MCLPHRIGDTVLVRIGESDARNFLGMVPGGFNLVSGTGGVQYCSDFVDFGNR